MEFIHHDKGIVLHNDFESSQSDLETQHGNTAVKSYIPVLEDVLKNTRLLIDANDLHLAKNLVSRGLQFYPKNIELLNLLATLAGNLTDIELLRKCRAAIFSIDASEESLIKLTIKIQSERSWILPSFRDRSNVTYNLSVMRPNQLNSFRGSNSCTPRVSTRSKPMVLWSSSCSSSHSRISRSIYCLL